MRWCGVVWCIVPYVLTLRLLYGDPGQHQQQQQQEDGAWGAAAAGGRALKGSWRVCAAACAGVRDSAGGAGVEAEKGKPQLQSRVTG